MDALVCKMCGYVALKGEAPDKCPVCGAPKSAFENKKGAIKLLQNSTNLTELEKKHIPIINIIKRCGLIPEGCVDVNVKIGEVLHPMQKEHFIMYSDCYINKEFIARVHLTPERLNPAFAFHLKEADGKFTAIDFCNLHGRWISEKEL